MYIIVGLGNPGLKYHSTRHNLGQNIVNRFVSQHYQSQLNHSSKTLCHIYLNPQGHLFATPDTYMNESGKAVSRLLTYYQAKPDQLYVVHDDLDLGVGEWKKQFDRGPAGHNGVKSIIEHLGTQSFHRLRVGIGHPQTAIPVEKYVLTPFLDSEKPIIEATADKILQEINRIISPSGP